MSLSRESSILVAFESKSCNWAIDAFVNMEDAFKGKAGNAIRGYFWDFHQPLLLYLQSFLAEYNK